MTSAHDALLARLDERAALLDELRGLIIDVLRLDIPPEHVDPNTPLFGAGLGLDSMDTLELVLEIETTFDVSADQIESDRYTLRNLNTLADLLVREGAWPR